MDTQDMLYNLFVNSNTSSIGPDNETGPPDSHHPTNGSASQRTSPKSRSATSSRLFKSQRRQTALSKSVIQKSLHLDCGCTSYCQKLFSANDIMRWRQKLHSVPQGTMRQTEVMNLIRQCSVKLSKHSKVQRYRVEQHTICRRFFIKVVLGISTASFTRGRADVFNGKFTAFYPSRRSGATQGTKGVVCAGFITAYMNSCCDRDPTGNLFRMPVSLTRQDLYHLYSTVQKDHLQCSAFYDILKKKVPELCFNKSQRLTKCTECNDFKCLIEKETDVEEKLKLMEMRNLHIRQQQIERESYYIRRGQAEMMPERYFSIIVDGMGQHKTNLPHYSGWNDPNDAGARKLKTHIVGGLAHGRRKHFYVDFNEYPHDTNLSLTCLLNILRDEARNEQLPNTLYVQLDNTTRENKNKYFLGMMAYLVKRNYIKECYMSFLIVGHTHEDVDQSFSKISHSLKSNTVLTREELLNTIQQSQGTPAQTTAANIDVVWNISRWLEPCINQVHNVTFPKMYRIFNDDTGHVSVQYKTLSCDEEWKPARDQRPIEIFRLDGEAEQVLPLSTPDIVTPSVDEDDIRELQRSLERKDFKLASFSDKSVEEWRDFLRTPLKRPGSPIWPLIDIKATTRACPASTLSPRQKEVVEEYIRKRQEFREVYTAQIQKEARGQYADRRHYSAGEMVIVLANDCSGYVAEVISITTKMIVQRYHKTTTNAYRPAQDGRKDVGYQQCLPGGFTLTTQGKLPKRTLDKVAKRGLKLI